MCPQKIVCICKQLCDCYKQTDTVLPRVYKPQHETSKFMFTLKAVFGSKLDVRYALKVLYGDQLNLQVCCTPTWG